MKTMKELAQDALDVQNACNLSGVTYAYARMMENLCQLVSGTDARNEHPIVILWLDKLCALAKIQDLGNSKVMKAYDWAYNQVNA